MQQTIEIWTTAAASPRGIVKLAREVEERGWDGLVVVDSQNLSGDPHVALTMAATPIASVQRVAGGRAVLGIRRGDSALAHLGRAPGRVAHSERYLRHLQAYLRGEAVPFDEINIPLDIASPLSELHLADAPMDSRNSWMAGTEKCRWKSRRPATG